MILLIAHSCEDLTLNLLLTSEGKEQGDLITHQLVIVRNLQVLALEL